jgi:hypothetical protein
VNVLSLTLGKQLDFGSIARPGIQLHCITARQAVSLKHRWAFGIRSQS